jgi:type IV pilus assembly protein PilQ
MTTRMTVFQPARALRFAAVASLVALLPTGTLAAQALVQGVKVNSMDGRTFVNVQLTDSVARTHFALENPHRLVLDLSGARLGGARGGSSLARGPIANVRLSQYRPDVVRVVMDLANACDYVVTGGAEIQVAFGASESTVAQADVPAPTELAMSDSMSVAGRAPSGEARTQVTYRSPENGITAPSLTPTRRGSAPKPRITVSYQEADIRDVIAAFASFSGRTIIVGRDVGGAVTADVKDKPWDEALTAILASQGLAASEEANGIIIVDSYKNMLDKQSLEPLATQVVTVNYGNANSMANTVRNLLTRDCVPGAGGPSVGAAGGGGGQANAIPTGCVVRGSVQADSATNSLLIREVQSRIEDVINYVRSIDRRTPQVAIKAKIIFVNRTSLEELGISYDLGTKRQFFSSLIPRQEVVQNIPVDNNNDGVNDGFRQVFQPVIGDRVDFGGSAISAVANANSRVSSPALNLLYSASIGKYALTPFIQALQETRLADVQAEPTVMTLDNRKAEILVGQEIPIRVLDAGAGAGGGAQGAVNIPRATVSLKEVGIALSVTPRITNNRQVLMSIHAENSSASLASSDVGFVFDKQRADNVLLVPDGETAVIGGLTVTQVTKSRSGIPILMNIPYIGRLFSTNRSQEQKRDLLILVTPHIVDEGEAIRTPGR